jgi:hypothetical protein
MAGVVSFIYTFNADSKGIKEFCGDLIDLIFDMGYD